MNKDRNDANKSPDELEHEIDDTRAQLDYTIDALRRRLSPGEVLDQAVEYWRDGPKEYASEMGKNLTHSVRDNPLALALVGVGVSWLMFGRGRAGVRAQYDYDDYEDYGDDVEVEVAAVSELYVPEGARTADRDDGNGEGKWNEAKERLAGGAKNIGDRATRARDAASEKLRRARRGIGASASKAGARGRRYGYQAGRQLDRARTGATELFNEHPLVVGALGIAAGALLAATIPSTRREDEWVGETSDRLADNARRKAEQGVDTARRATRAAATGAQDEAQKQGLTPEAAEDALRGAAEKVERVAHAAGDAASQEAKRGDGADHDHTASPPYPHH